MLCLVVSDAEKLEIMHYIETHYIETMEPRDIQGRRGSK